MTMMATIEKEIPTPKRDAWFVPDWIPAMTSRAWMLVKSIMAG